MVKANVETRCNEYRFLRSGCNTYEHIFPLMSRAARAAIVDYFIEIWARWLTRGEDRSDEAWRQIQWGEPLF